MTDVLSRPAANAPAGPPPPPRAKIRPPWEWTAAGASAAAVLLCSLSLHGVLDGWSWLPPLTLTTAAVIAAMAAARRFRFPTALVPAAGLAALAVVLTWLFAASTALLGLLPTGATLGRGRQLLTEAQATIMNQVPPVLADSGIVFIACLGTGLIALLVDTLATTLRMPAASGLGLLSLLIVPAVLKPESIGALPFILAAAGYLLILATGAWQERPHRPGDAMRRPPRSQVGTAAGIGAGAMILALCLPAALPGFNQGTFPQGSRLNIWTGQSGLNPVVALGNDLRQPSASGRIRYATDSPTSLYLRSTTLEDFSGRRWAPDLREDTRRRGLQDMSPAEVNDRAPAMSVVTTRVSSETYVSPWLLAPYAPQRVSGALGPFSWDPKTMTVISGDNTERGKLDYEVQSLAPNLSQADLQGLAPASKDAVDPVFTSLPEDLPASIRDAAAAATEGTSGPYEQAMAIQAYLRGPAFSYSLDAPVEGGYDGNGIDVLDRFLQEKSGYCTHFAAAMAVMAREAGIPSRMALGFAPGRSTGNSFPGNDGQELREFEVDSRDAHAWPELYFEGLGWVRFEPTPSRGSVPAYAVEPRSNPTQVRDDERDLEAGNPVLPEPLPETSTSAAAPEAAAPPQPEETHAGRFAGVGFGLAAAAGALLSPWLLRRRRRSIRRRLLGPGQPARGRAGASGAGGAGHGHSLTGPATLAWEEAADTGVDYGHVPQKAESPRAYALRLAHEAGLADNSAAALERLRAAYEHEVYAAPAARPQGASGAARDLPPDPGAGLWSDVTAVRQGLQESATWGAKLRARFFPASLASRFQR
ncbi:transglutaminase family protein [Arthrobacter sunyaminii]|uniref:DUF3488 and transglutaminase-like domain-containing protein n=1 Tax=Arthrobacter sunyaminii TaxID=2816859 RepID=A0A975S798_9MICC|nr:DUF3488 and transglutaminase-like domain-containing protein [Arthrobacter sunyaminii]MBO0896406.1 transglutaminase domain-containing protein [Arthrobacter sunyaminii]MBO0908111.1 transglutaminase domain-containing protein [Arthrobacter sunyaminii]QWQ37125.1 DUF3488 and transglutaminase-like domain-containing protein [Arthrobacter sunyaminii]